MLIACAAVLGQQQLLLHQPPRLLRLVPQQVQSGSAALDLQFSRPMNRARVSEATRLTPTVPRRWLGETTPLRMVIDADVVLQAPIKLSLAGEDQRELQLNQQQWWWDPRPWLIATRPVQGGEQVQLRHGQGNGASQPGLACHHVVPLGNGEELPLWGVIRTAPSRCGGPTNAPQHRPKPGALGPPKVSSTNPC